MAKRSIHADVWQFSCLGETGDRVDEVWKNLIVWEDHEVHPRLRVAKQIKWDWGEKPGIHYTAQHSLIEDVLWTGGMDSLIVSTRFRDWHESMWPKTAEFEAHRIHNIASDLPVCNGNYWHMKILPHFTCTAQPTNHPYGGIERPDPIDLRYVEAGAVIWHLTGDRDTVYCVDSYRQACIAARLRGPQWYAWSYIDRSGAFHKR
jgi:hypothetical protein